MTTSTAPAKRTIAIEMTFQRSTKNTHVFSAPDGSAVEVLYVAKVAYAKAPAKIRIAIEVLE
jgi:hypothetical protein